MISPIDSGSSSLTVSWPSVPGAVRYRLEYRRAVCSGDSDTFETLSDKLATTQARKRNLEDTNDSGFFFRAGAITSDDQQNKAWVTHTDPFRLLSKEEESARMDPPRITPAGANETLNVKWDQYTRESVKGYELQMRENDGGMPWKTIATSLSGTEVRKKNLSSKLGYQFRVRPVLESSTVPAFSPPSDAVVAPGLSDGIRSLFRTLEDGRLLQNPSAKPIPLADALGGKEFVLLYASARWCGPCRQFTPQLARWYNSLPVKSVEVVFLSADHDENGFQSYYSSMPWLAVAFDDDTRENLMGYIRVTGIPRLVVLDGKTGRTIEDNVVGKPLDIGRWRNQAATKK